MKDMNWLAGKIMLLFLALAILVNLLAWNFWQTEGDKTYKISLNRIGYALLKFEEEEGRAAGSLKELAEYARMPGYQGVTRLVWTEAGQCPAFGAAGDEMEGRLPWEEFWANESQDYRVIATPEYFYKILYEAEHPAENLFLWVNITALAFLMGIVCLILYLRRALLRPFWQFTQYPYQLSKGELVLPVKENKNRFFGKFLWGMDMLRESLEGQKQRELELLREKKLLLLSLSHDIKTPLSAIKLYARALGRDLYREEEKKRRAADAIHQKADEIEQYISRIIRASREDFLDFQVQNQEVYVLKVLEEIRTYYQEKMAINQISFQMGRCPNCLVYADFDRLVEVLQNVVENAMKYGDGRLIHIYAEREEEEYRIIIKNSGCELSGKELPHIFDSFFRGSNVKKQPGSGLGLYICRQLMHQMEGEITASVEPGADGCFFVVVAALRTL